MLTHLQLRDLILVDRAELEPDAGLNALTGETGAGKSIIVDALLLIAGGRAAGDIVRQGAERAEIIASFNGFGAAARAWLEAQSLPHEDELVVRRVVGADGRSRAYVNGQVVPLQTLRELADFLIQIHGQQEFQRLVQRGAQRELLDARLSDPALLSRVYSLYARLTDCRQKLEELRTASANRASRMELLKYQLQELQEEVGSQEEIEALFADRRRIAGRSKLAAAARAALRAAYEGEPDNAHDLLGRAQAALRTAAESDPALVEPARLLGEAVILAQEAAGSLRHYLDALEVDPARQEEIERHAAALEALSRKHRVPVAELPVQLAATAQELSGLDKIQGNLAALEDELAVVGAEYRSAAAKLGTARKAAARTLSRQVGELMQELGMAGGSFEAAVTSDPESLTAGGSDDIEFLVSANPGQPRKALAKVASGGELSRISLAIQVAAAAHSTSLCMVFDEVDAGIGGAVAEIVGRQLRALSGRVQVLCVTHLPQVASQAHAQFRVSKRTIGKVTRTAIEPLGVAERVDEIARMLGGVDVSEQARAHAREMLELASR